MSGYSILCPEDEAIIDFALRLQPLGGPSNEAIRSAFALSRGQFRARVREILDDAGPGRGEPVVYAARALLDEYFEPDESRQPEVLADARPQ
ncbi:MULTISPECIES: hypothetical protein [unclassified Nocardia]|uniref:hypothetical protein n=1 Tax=unclassified Nocardia TaxID=2637762 RepID=UPI0033A3D2FD